MAFLALWLFLLLQQTFAELEVLAPSRQEVLVGSSVVLPCTFSITPAPIDPKYLSIIWMFQGRQLVYLYSTGSVTLSGVIFNDKAARAGTASITLRSMTLADGGTYSCAVRYSPERIEKKIELEVQARPVIILPDQVVYRGRENTLWCVAANFYPRNITITWSLDGQPLNNSNIGKEVINKDGSYNVTSYVMFSPTMENKTISCIVHHASLPVPLHKNLVLTYAVLTEGGHAGTIAACVIVVVLIIIIIAGVLWWKRRPGRKDGKKKLMENTEQSRKEMIASESKKDGIDESREAGDVREATNHIKEDL